MRFDITELLEAGRRVGLDPKPTMTIALYFLSNEGKLKNIEVAVADQNYDIKVGDNMKQVFDELMQKPNYYAFYEALKRSAVVNKKV